MSPDYNHTWENIEEPAVILYTKHRMEFIYEMVMPGRWAALAQ
jgi:hypothetical protein